jgi:hypothetical protein
VCSGTEECANRVDDTDVEYLAAFAGASARDTDKRASSWSSRTPRYAVLKHYIIKKSSGEATTNQDAILARVNQPPKFFDTFSRPPPRTIYTVLALINSSLIPPIP